MPPVKFEPTISAGERPQALEDHNTRTVAIYTDSKVTLASFKNSSIHSFLTEEIRNMVGHLTMLNWTIHFGWVKTHTGFEGNEVADKLGKEAAQEADDQNIVYARIPTTSVAAELKKEGIVKWQRQWESTEKGAICRSFFPSVEQRFKMKLLITPEFTAIVTGHEKTKSYLLRFKLTDNLTCPSNKGVQTPEHLIYDCKLLEDQKSSLKQHIMADGGNWPTTNNELVASYLKSFSRFVKCIDFNKLQ
jgi:hypothetical protein